MKSWRHNLVRNSLKMRKTKDTKKWKNSGQETDFITTMNWLVLAAVGLIGLQPNCWAGGVSSGKDECTGHGPISLKFNFTENDWGAHSPKLAPSAHSLKMTGECLSYREMSQNFFIHLSFHGQSLQCPNFTKESAYDFWEVSRLENEYLESARKFVSGSIS